MKHWVFVLALLAPATSDAAPFRVDCDGQADSQKIADAIRDCDEEWRQTKSAEGVEIAGHCRLTAPIRVDGACSVRGLGVGVGTKLFWDGPPGTDCIIDRPAGAPGGMSFTDVGGFTVEAGISKPGTVYCGEESFLDVFADVGPIQCAKIDGDCIRVKGIPANLHLDQRKVRCDNVSGCCVRVMSTPGTNNGSVKLRVDTFDTAGNGSSPGAICLDSTLGYGHTIANVTIDIGRMEHRRDPRPKEDPWGIIRIIRSPTQNQLTKLWTITAIGGSYDQAGGTKNGAFVVCEGKTPCDDPLTILGFHGKPSLGIVAGNVSRQRNFGVTGTGPISILSTEQQENAVQLGNLAVRAWSAGDAAVQVFDRSGEFAGTKLRPGEVAVGPRNAPPRSRMYAEGSTLQFVAPEGYVKARGKFYAEGWIPGTKDISALPAGPQGRVAIIRNGAHEADCSVGGGNHRVWCVYQHPIWVPIR